MRQPTQVSRRAPADRPGTLTTDEVVGRFAWLLAGDAAKCWDNLDGALDLLRRATDADAAELFVAEPDGNDLVMVACVADDPDAFLQRTRFRPDTGFPGIVVRQRQPLVTRHLADDPRYLRSMVVQQGYRAYACVPVAGPHRPAFASLHLAWRHSDPLIERASEVLDVAGRLLGLVLDADFRAAEDRVARWSREFGDDHPEEALRHLLTMVQAEAGATHGQLILASPPGTVSRRISLFGADATWAPHAHCDPCRCGFLAGGHGSIVTGGHDSIVTGGHGSIVTGGHGSIVTGGHGSIVTGDQADCPVTELGDDRGFCCLPLVTNGRFAGAIQLGYRESPSQVPSRRLPHLLHVARSLARNAALLDLEQSGGNERAGPSTAARPAMAQPRHRLVLRCFGRFRIVADGTPIGSERFPRKHTIELLKMLALRGGTAISRHLLAEWLWPESSEEAAANRLYVTVHALRRTLETSGGCPSIGDFIRREPGTYALAPLDDVWVDVVAFREFVASGRQHLREGRSAAAAEDLRAAVALYEGDLFEDSPYADWCAIERVELQRAFLDALEFLAADALRSGDHSAAIAYLRRALAWEPLREDLRQQLVRSLIDLGRRGEAWVQYQECVWLVRRELDMEPLPETIGLESLLRASADRPEDSSANRPHPLFDQPQGGQ